MLLYCKFIFLQNPRSIVMFNIIIPGVHLEKMRGLNILWIQNPVPGWNDSESKKLPINYIFL